MNLLGKRVRVPSQNRLGTVTSIDPGQYRPYGVTLDEGYLGLFRYDELELANPPVALSGLLEQYRLAGRDIQDLVDSSSQDFVSLSEVLAKFVGKQVKITIEEIENA